MGLIQTEKIQSLVLGLLLLILSPLSAFGWVNTGFETGNTTGWITNTSVTGSPFVTVNTSGAAVNTNGTAMGNPALCPSPSICLNRVHSGTFAAELYSGVGDINHLDWASIQQTDTVPANQPILTIWFAAVLEGAHYLLQDPTPNGDSEVELDVIVGGQTVFTQQYSWYVDVPPPSVTAPLVPPLGPPIYPVTLIYDGTVDASGVTWAHLPWTQYAYDFSAYAGQQVTIKYTAFDCSGGAHYCYGYLDDTTWNNPGVVSNPTPIPCFSSGGNTCTPTPTSSLPPPFTPTATETPCGYPGDTCTPTPVPPEGWYISKNVVQLGNQESVSIHVSVADYPGNVELKVYNSAGEFITTLLSKNISSSWDTFCFWDGTNFQHDKCASGVYILVLDEPSTRRLARIILVR